MSDFVAAVGLVFVLEGILFAAFPAMTRRAMESALQTPEPVLRIVGIASAILGLFAIWMVRG